MKNKALEVLKQLQLKFTSGNDLKVERVTITRKEWKAIEPFLKAILEISKTDVQDWVAIEVACEQYPSIIGEDLYNWIMPSEKVNN